MYEDRTCVNPFSIVRHNICLTLIFYNYTGSFGISDIHCMIFIHLNLNIKWYVYWISYKMSLFAFRYCIDFFTLETAQTVCELLYYSLHGCAFSFNYIV